ncbi:MAG: indole-3-glycerol phosphate synthase TrpC [Nitrospiraceae bacterium]|nr:MAG: indole-3-glycerol phosphate synthase TrpC [Nitrospiraceae bacterium]
MSILNEILKNKKEELAAAKSSVSLTDLRVRAKDAQETKSFRAAIQREANSPVKLIAEIKKASPSGGQIRKDFNLSEIISVYNKKDVAAISVITEERFFSGKLDFLNKARKKTGKPLLRKDFIIDEYQVYESRVNQADAILLIVAALDKFQLGDLFELAKCLSLDCLVEVHDWKELDLALYCGAEIIGINNRDLKTLNINLRTTLDLLKDIPDDRIVVSESGINSRIDVQTVEATRTDAILVGTALMKATDIGKKIDELQGKEEIK